MQNRTAIALFLLTWIWHWPALAATAPDAKCGIPADFDPASIPPALRNPPMMAIGDSLYNGVTSLTINKEYAARSVPGLVADAFAIPFSRPLYPRPLLFEMEVALEQLSSPFDAWIDFRPNLERWDRDRDATKTIGPGDEIRPDEAAAMPTMFDNIAVAQMAIDDLFLRTANVAETELKGLRGPDGQVPDSVPLKDIARWFFALNTRFVLDPRHTPGMDHLSPMGQVIARSPARLLVNIGSNDGVWMMGFDAKLPGDPADDGVPIQRHIDHFVESVGLLADCVPDSVREVYFNSLPLPSVTANLQPDTSSGPEPTNPHYYARYTNYFSTDQIRTITGAQLSAMDSAVLAANYKAQDVLRGKLGNRAIYVDLRPVLDQYDYKHNRNDAHRLVVECPNNWPPDYRLSNMFAGFAEQPIQRLCPQKLTYLNEGGLIGLDGMHPTLFGYALVARAVRDAISTTESIKPAKDDLLQPSRLYALHMKYQHELPDQGSPLAAAVLDAWHRILLSQAPDATQPEGLRAIRALSGGLFKGPPSGGEASQ